MKGQNPFNITTQQKEHNLVAGYRADGKFSNREFTELDQILKKYNKNSKNKAAAATTIQAAFRGKKTRNKAAANKLKANLEKEAERRRKGKGPAEPQPPGPSTSGTRTEENNSNNAVKVVPAPPPGSGSRPRPGARPRPGSNDEPTSEAIQAAKRFVKQQKNKAAAAKQQRINAREAEAEAKATAEAKAKNNDRVADRRKRFEAKFGKQKMFNLNEQELSKKVNQAVTSGQSTNKLMEEIEKAKKLKSNFNKNTEQLKGLEPFNVQTWLGTKKGQNYEKYKNQIIKNLKLKPSTKAGVKAAGILGVAAKQKAVNAAKNLEQKSLAAGVKPAFAGAVLKQTLPSLKEAQRAAGVQKARGGFMGILKSQQQKSPTIQKQLKEGYNSNGAKEVPEEPEASLKGDSFRRAQAKKRNALKKGKPQPTQVR